MNNSYKDNPYKYYDTHKEPQRIYDDTEGFTCSMDKLFAWWLGIMIAGLAFIMFYHYVL